MNGKNRGIVIFAFLFGGVGILFLLWGLGVSVGKWWPAFFTAVGLASFARGMREMGNVIMGLLLVGWSIAGIVCLHATELEIDHALPFFIGVFILWIPLAWLFGKFLSTDTK